MKGTQQRRVCPKCGKVFFAWRPDELPGASVKCYYCGNVLQDEEARRPPLVPPAAAPPAAAPPAAVAPNAAAPPEAASPPEAAAPAEPELEN